VKGSATEKLRRFFDQFSSEDRVLIAIQADPDSIASAMAVKRLLWRRTSHIAIASLNVVKRPDNVAMIRLLGVNLVHTDEIDKNDYNRFVIVDSQPNHNEGFAQFRPNVVIDHHPETNEKAPFWDIRPKYGATATILTEYLRAAKITPSVKLATGLFYAIKTDTSNFERQTLIEDIRAFQYLFRHTNIHLARKIEQSEISFAFLKYFSHALQKMRKRKGNIFVHLGPVLNPDACVLIADFFSRVQSVRWTVISGLYNNKLIIIFRNDGLRKNAGKVAAQSFGLVGSAGGHKSMARAEIPVKVIKDLVDFRDDKKLLRWIINRIEKRAEKKE
jgi:nanoRNase/pAp phosphatase (c-di-AMP/oligoRNAs hydrolase)